MSLTVHFLTLNPDTGIITSLDPDHLDIYGTKGRWSETTLPFGALANRLLVHHSLKDRGWTVPIATFGIEERRDSGEKPAFLQTANPI